MSYYWNAPQFYGIKAQADNLGKEKGDYTAEMFAEDFPQFRNEEGESFLPSQILEMFINLANSSIQKDKWFEMWRYAAGLYVAHNATLFLRTYSSSSTSASQAAASGALIGSVKSAKLGDSSVTYDDDALTKATEGWGDLNATQYGQLLATQARLVGMGGTLVI